MEAIKFPEQNETLAKNQPQFRALPVCIRPINPDDPREGAQFTVKYELSEIELAQILLTGCVYFSQFGSCFQPICPQIESPFGFLPIKWEKTNNFEFTAWVPLDQGGEEVIHGLTANGLITNILLRFTNLQPEQLYFIPAPKMAIDEKGNIIDL